MKLNAKPSAPKTPPTYTHQGGRAAKQTPLQELRRAVLTTMLWEDSFYETGESVADRIGALTKECCKTDALGVAALAVAARTEYNLRHAPLLVICGMVAAKAPYVRVTIRDCVQRADEPGELLAMLRHNGLTGCIPRQVRLGLQDALRKFTEYDLAKYDRDSAKFRLRDVFRLVRPKPENNTIQEELWRKAVKRELKTPDTWEVAISACKGNPTETRATWGRLLEQKKLGGLALLRNLRNMTEAGIAKADINNAILTMKTDRVLPFRYVAAYRAAPHHRAALDAKLLESCTHLPQFKGRTAILVDISGSMDSRLSAKSDMRRLDAAACLAAIIRETCDDPRIFAFDTTTHELERPGHGLVLVEELSRSGGGTDIDQAVRAVDQHCNPTRIIVVTDEQAMCKVSEPNTERCYMINVAPYKNGIATDGKWHKINGFSEAVPQYIAALETL